MNILEATRKKGVLNQLRESGRWIPVDLLGRAVEGDLAEHAEFVACAKCGKRYKWNQESWIAKHEREHGHKAAISEQTDAPKPELVHSSQESAHVESNAPTLEEIESQLWALMESIDLYRKANAEDKRKKA